MKRLLPLCALLAGAPLVASAGDEVGHWYVDPEIGAIRVDSDRPTKQHDWLYGLGVGYNFSEAWTAELNLNGTRLSDRYDRGNLKLDGLSLDVLRVFNRPGVFAPYITVGAGALREDPSLASNSTHFMAEGGVGAFIKLWENADASSSFSLKPEIKARWDDSRGFGNLSSNPGHLVDYIGTMGFVFSWGPPGVTPAAAAPPPPPPPPPVATAAPPPPPVVPAAPLDSDHDGVPDSIDRCPNTPPGVAVDQYGCPQKGSITLEGVTFEVNSAVLTGESEPVLDKVAEGLSKHPRLKVELQGHTDSSGSAPYNLTLSRKRAEAVRDFLVNHGVSASQLTAKGYGKTQPIADNSTALGRAKNRRVVMMVLENPGDVKVEGEGQAP